MDHISDEDLRKVPAEIIKSGNRKEPIIVYDDETICDIHKLMNAPLEIQKEEAAILYNYLYQKRKKEIEEKGIISDHTRRIMEGYHTLLDNIQKSMFGQKSLNVHMHGGMTPAHIASFISKNGDNNVK